MTRSHAILTGPFFLAIVAIAFSIWSALGNDVNFCVTTGCTLYQDFTLWGISLWWFGAAAFFCLGACAILGAAGLGVLLASFFLFGDICLLALMSFTAPCISCMVAAVFFALIYYLLHRFENAHGRPGTPKKHSVLIWIWLFFFVINMGQVARSQMDVWPMLDESGEAHTRMFFSPTCKYCLEGINVLSGNVNVAFYPVADTDQDVYRIARAMELLSDGMSLAEAVGQSIETPAWGFFSSLRPDIMLLRFRLLRNKAHVFGAGSQGVPFFEYKGLPPGVQAKSRERSARAGLGINGDTAQETPRAPVSTTDPALPPELDGLTQCGAGLPCPPGNQF